jgi:hypothetical protein
MPARRDTLGPSQPRSWRPSLRSRRAAADPIPARLTTAQARCGSLKTPFGASSDCPNRDRLKSASYGRGGVTESPRSRSRARDPSDPQLAKPAMNESKQGSERPPSCPRIGGRSRERFGYPSERECRSLSWRASRAVSTAREPATVSALQTDPDQYRITDRSSWSEASSSFPVDRGSGGSC